MLESPLWLSSAPVKKLVFKEHISDENFFGAPSLLKEKLLIIESENDNK
jgi:hypothetical protein